MEDWKQVRKRKLEKDEKSTSKNKHSKLSDDTDLNKSPDIVELSDSDSDIIENKDKPDCKYGTKCFRKNPDHFNELSHPKKDSDTEEICPKSSSLSKKTISENFIKYTKINIINPNKSVIKNHNKSFSLNDILSLDKENFIESIQFNYCHDIVWTLQQYPKENRAKPLLIVHGPAQESQLKPTASQFYNVKLCKAKLDIDYGTHHTKMMILFYKNGMRVVVGTANLNEEDWGLKTQGIWISELFPCISDEQKQDLNSYAKTDSKTKFRQYLMMYIEHYSNPILNELVKKFKSYDMSSANVFLIGSIPGRFPSTQKLFGHLRLKKILSDHVEILNEEEDGEKAKNIICQFSSIGSLGPNGNSWLCKEFSSSLSAKKEPKKIQNLQPICIFPCVSDVRNSYEGYSAGLSIPYSMKVSQKQLYLNNFLYKWKADSNHRTKASPHIKSYARYSDDFSKMYWFLLTSSNLSKAAWGSYEKNESQLFMRSYELGVLFLPQFFLKNETSKNYYDLEDKQTILPYDLPPVKYSDNDKPWVYDISYQQPDSHDSPWIISHR